MRARLALFASGSGTTVETIIRTSCNDVLPIEPCLLVCNKSDAYVVERVRKLHAELGLHIKIEIINQHTNPDATPANHLPGQQTASEESAILQLLRSENIDLVVLAGYLRQIGPSLIAEYGWEESYTSPFQASMLNTHPGLLPATKGAYGLHAQELVIRSGDKEAGQTLHVVATAYDSGPKVAEHRIQVMQGETPEQLFDRVQRLEKQHITKDISSFWEAKQAYQHN